MDDNPIMNPDKKEADLLDILQRSMSYDVSIQPIEITKTKIPNFETSQKFGNFLHNKN